MMAPLQRLIESLRNELQQYGEMLALLDQQHQAVLYQGGDDILHSISAINTQSSLIQKARQIRQEAASSMARFLSQPEQVTFAQLIPLLPEHVQPLVTALVQENNALLRDVRTRAQRNHHLLQRSVDLMKVFIDNIASSDTTLIPLSPENKTPAVVPPDVDLYEAIA
jgi:hypothetical protein